MKYEFTKEYYMGFDIVNRNAMAIAYSGAKIETPKASTTAGNIYTAYVDGSGADDVYISCDTPGSVIYYASAANKLDDLADAVANGTLVKNGGKVTVAADTFVRAFRTDGTITQSDILTIDIA
jgi:hypothetical protein